jgi:drug/metabolite transporter (DMT)-like permease
VLIFAATLPMTRLAVGPADAPQLPPGFVTAARAAGAGLLSALTLWAWRSRRPGRAEWPALVACAIGTVLGFPICIAMALREVPAAHAAVVTGVLPLATAVAAALLLRQRAGAGFWACAVAGCALVLAFAWHEGGGRVTAADLWLAGAVVLGALGYVAGHWLSRAWPAEQVIGWVLVISLPFTIVATAWTWPAAPVMAAVRPAAWGALAYVTLFSMWIGFFAWYRGLALGGVLRVSQVQLLQPFLALLLAVPLLGEPLRPSTLAWAAAVLAVVAAGRQLSRR